MSTDSSPNASAGRVLIVDDSHEMRDFMRWTLEYGGFQVVAEAENAVEGIEHAERFQPDLVMLDLHMPEVGGLEVIPDFNEVARKSKVIVYSAIGATFMTEAALRAGVWAYIEKGVSPRSIITHLNRVMKTGAVRPVKPYPLSRDYPDGVGAET